MPIRIWPGPFRCWCRSPIAPAASAPSSSSRRCSSSPPSALVGAGLPAPRPRRAADGARARGRHRGGAPAPRRAAAPRHLRRPRRARPRCSPTSRRAAPLVVAAAARARVGAVPRRRLLLRARARRSSCAGAALDRAARCRGAASPSRCALTVAAMFATPAGTRLPRYLLWHTGLGATRIIDEFRHADAWNDPWFFVLVALVPRHRGRAPSASLARAPAASPSPRWLASRSVRFVAEFALLAAPLVADGLDRLLRAHAPRARRVARPPSPLAVAAALFAHRRRRARRRSRAAAPRRRRRPVRRHRLRHHDRPAPPHVPRPRRRLLSRPGKAGRAGRSSRTRACPPIPTNSTARSTTRPTIRPPSTRSSAATASTPRSSSSPAPTAAPARSIPTSGRWCGARADALVFARRTPEHAALIAAREIPLAIRFRWEDGMHTAPLAEPPRALAGRRAASGIAASPPSSRATATSIARSTPARDALAHGCLGATRRGRRALLPRRAPAARTASSPAPPSSTTACSRSAPTTRARASTAPGRSSPPQLVRALRDVVGSREPSSARRRDPLTTSPIRGASCSCAEFRRRRGR